MTARALMVCGTSSDAGKTAVVTGLCRLLARRGVRVAPFKAQNMALNSFVTPDGHEIGRAQAAQAQAAGIDPHVDMNPILLKPTGERTSQVMVLGRPAGHLDAAAYHAEKPRLLGVVLDALARLRDRFDVVIMEGAGSPAEINLLDHDIVNLRIAHAAGAPVIVVGDIDRGGVFASLYGTVALLPDELRSLVRGFVINKFRGDPTLLTPGLADLLTRTGVPTLGVIPWISGLDLDAEDSLALDGRTVTMTAPAIGDSLDIAVVRFPRVSNFTDVDALACEPGVGVRWVDHPAGLGDPDLVVLPGTKATVSDLEWCRGRGFPAVLARCTTVLGICGGYQMLGRTIVDPIESGRGAVDGLGLLPVDTVFHPAKVTLPRRGHAMGQHVTGYQIHHGVVNAAAGHGWVHLDDVHGTHDDGCVALDGSVLGVTLHGLFESDGFRSVFLTEIGRRRDKTFIPAGVSFRAAREARFDRLADVIASHVDIDAVDRLLGGVPAAP
jgi:adenosylcobyric acid synthase